MYKNVLNEKIGSAGILKKSTFISKSTFNID